MRRICLAPPTNRACGGMITATGAEAGYAAERSDVEAHLLAPHSSDPADRAEHAFLAAELTPVERVVTHHPDKTRQRDFLKPLIDARAPLTAAARTEAVRG
ncbi:DUF6271 family protein [Kitasatospora purpeofusca]|uniref:DUF6271 family protein n=1 Tax=Kitasatospora purpeofusca TaxID=67352 RepID=UPI0036D390FB